MNYTFRLTEEQSNQVVAALAKQPFEQVYNLVSEFQRQAKEQLDAANRSNIEYIAKAATPND
jgi:hypothetical protein